MQTYGLFSGAGLGMQGGGREERAALSRTGVLAASLRHS